MRTSLTILAVVAFAADASAQEYDGGDVWNYDARRSSALSVDRAMTQNAYSGEVIQNRYDDVRARWRLEDEARERRLSKVREKRERRLRWKRQRIPGQQELRYDGARFESYDQFRRTDSFARMRAAAQSRTAEWERQQLMIEQRRQAAFAFERTRRLYTFPDVLRGEQSRSTALARRAMGNAWWMARIEAR